MGYSTDFSGTIYFEDELTASQIVTMGTILGNDMRDWPELKEHLDPDADEYLSHIDLCFNDDFTGIEWDGTEKSHGLPDFINMIRNYMESIGKPITFQDGEMFAQGEDATDRWRLVVDGNVAKKVVITVTGREVECPHCEETFFIDLETSE